MEKQDKDKKSLPVITVSEKVSNGSGRYINNLARIMDISNSNDINRVLSVMFSKLGLNERDNVVIEDVLKNAWDMVELQFKINDEKTWYIKFHNRFGRDLLGAAVVDDKKDWYSYYCKILGEKLPSTTGVKEEETSVRDIDILMRLKKYTVGLGTGNMKDFLSCERGHQGVLYCFGSPVSKNGKNAQEIYFKINCPNDMAKQNIDNEGYYAPKNEKALIAYLSNVSYPVKIDKIYQDILNLCFDGDMPEYPLFDLHILMSKQQKGEEERIITDSVILRDGKLKAFGMMHNGSVEGCSVKNVGATVEFIGNGWMNYHVFTPKNGYVTFGTQGIEEEDSLIDPNLVREVADRMIEMFPEQAERMLGEAYYSKCMSSRENDQVGLFAMGDAPKQFKKSDDMKKD